MSNPACKLKGGFMSANEGKNRTSLQGYISLSNNPNESSLDMYILT